MAEADRFWQLADDLQEKTVSHAKELFSYAETANPDDLLSLLIQYRFFTIYYIPDIAILVARMRDGQLRSFLADILTDELGNGDPAKAHPRLYDDFLKSIGAPLDLLDDLAVKDNIEMLQGIRGKLIDPRTSTAYGVGLRGMGGECVCQVYLSRFHEHIVKNPFIRQRRADVDWTFWDLHVGEHDIEHRLKTRQLIDEEIVSRGATDIVELEQGYRESMASWSAFWSNVFASVKSRNVQRVSVNRAVDWRGTAAGALA
ncbi:iron-containing redox enzyme family protein [Piscinibacter sp.]|uniref:iron-containing redox enzyme family protein n=1 Tax=Piscinibacter sp. TaxID=1903157 RepID=UPI002B9AD886|nr:iron-containing redox enzyme family protein [Albitalea sp.]HUG23692.1 iron-containing redox enzyme family protein [Albitalea sp.]